MKNKFMTDKEYETCFSQFWGIRKKIAQTLIPFGLQSSSKILDVAAGHGFFTIEIAKLLQKGEINAIGLQNDLESYQNFTSSLDTKDSKIIKKIKYSIMDAADLTFKDETFDFVVNFLGLEDINMTRGKNGLQKAIREFSRVLKQGGVLQLTICLEGDEPDQLLAKEITQDIGHQAMFYQKEFYIDELVKNNIDLTLEKWFYTKRKMTAKQAKEELQFACEETPKIFEDYKIQTKSFETLWEKYHTDLKKHGMAYYSQLLVIIGKKL